MAVPSSLRSSSVQRSGGKAPPPHACAPDGCASRVGEESCPARKYRRSTPDEGAAALSVVVVFADQADCPWLRVLRRGFRHCFVVLRAGSVWLACDPLKDRIALDILDLPGEFDLPGFYHEQGHRVLVGQRPPPTTRRRFALAPLTCVTVVKRLLGLDAPWVWTPWQLYSHLSAWERGYKPWSASAKRHCTVTTRVDATLDTAPR